MDEEFLQIAYLSKKFYHLIKQIGNDMYAIIVHTSAAMTRLHLQN